MTAHSSSILFRSFCQYFRIFRSFIDLSSTGLTRCEPWLPSWLSSTMCFLLSLDSPSVGKDKSVSACCYLAFLIALTTLGKRTEPMWMVPNSSNTGRPCCFCLSWIVENLNAEFFIYVFLEELLSVLSATGLRREPEGEMEGKFDMLAFYSLIDFCILFLIFSMW